MRWGIYISSGPAQHVDVIFLSHFLESEEKIRQGVGLTQDCNRSRRRSVSEGSRSSRDGIVNRNDHKFKFVWRRKSGRDGTDKLEKQGETKELEIMMTLVYRLRDCARSRKTQNFFVVR